MLLMQVKILLAYLGLRKNLFDLRCLSVVHNLHVLARMSVFTNKEPSIQIA